LGAVLAIDLCGVVPVALFFGAEAGTRMEVEAGCLYVLPYRRWFFRSLGGFRCLGGFRSGPLLRDAGSDLH